MAEVPWLNESEMKAWRLLLNTTTGVLATLDRELQAAHGLTLPEYEVLVILEEAGEGGLRMSDLAGHLHLSPSGLTRRIDGLTKRRLVRRDACPSDRRVSYAVLTPLGRTKLKQAAPTHVQGVRAHFIDRLSERQLTQLAGALGAVEVDLDAAAGGCDEVA